MSTDTSGLTQLGGHIQPPTNPDQAVLERAPNPHPDTLYLARFTAPEFTSLCPVTGPGEGGTEDSTHPTGADHTDPQTRRMPVALHGERPYPRGPAAGVHAKSRTQPRVGG